MECASQLSRGAPFQPLRAAPITRRCSQRPSVATRAAHAIRASAALPHNLIGIHSGVFVGDWRPEDAERAIKGAKDAGFDLIERTFLACPLQ